MINDVKKSGLVYSYLRFSDPRQSAGSSTDRQLAYAQRWAAEHGLTLDASLSLRDEGLSAYHQQHVKSGALGVFLRAVEDGRVPAGSVLIVEGLDRLSRAEPIQAQAQLAQIISAGITVVINQGHDPEWLIKLPGPELRFELHPARAQALRLAVQLYTQGMGGKGIVSQLDAQGLHLFKDGGLPNSTAQVYRVLKMPQLVGDKPVTVDGEAYLLRGYYPPVLTSAQWQELQRVAAQSGRRRIKGDLPHIITGLGITVCGYCGKPMAGQHLGTKPRLPDGRIRDGYRRLLCASAAAYGGGCPVPGSTSVAPIERAIMDFCSDIANLQSLYGPDRSAAPRAQAHAARERVQHLTQQIDRLTDAMLASSTEGTPLAFARKARALEEELAQAQAQLTQAEAEMASTSRSSPQGADAAWRELADGVLAQDVQARLRARQLVADTFERIVVYHHGMRPDPQASARDYEIDLVLAAKGGTARLLRVTRQGDWTAGDDAHVLGAA